MVKEDLVVGETTSSSDSTPGEGHRRPQPGLLAPLPLLPQLLPGRLARRGGNVASGITPEQYAGECRPPAGVGAVIDVGGEVVFIFGVIIELWANIMVDA